MGGAIASGLAGKTNNEISVFDPDSSKTSHITKEHSNIAIANDNRSLVIASDIVVIAVKPYLVRGVIEEIKSVLNLNKQKLISIAAGISLAQLEEFLGIEPYSDTSIFVAIPNTALMVGAGVTFISSHRPENADAKTIANLFSTMGIATVIPEKLMPAAMALCSCGIAYAFKYIQACVQAGVELGFRPDDALKYSIETVAGAMKLLQENGDLPQQEIDRVTTPGGLTIKGINQLDHSAFTSSVIKAFIAPLK